MTIASDRGIHVSDDLLTKE